MSFLQPILLAALPLVGLPIVIHLINQWRHRTIEWGAMMFLLDAKRMTRGMHRLRFWLIMAMRMLAVAALLFAVARPLTSGWLGLAVGGEVETTIIILDRSASMEQQDLSTGRSKRTAALAQIASVMESAGRGSRIVLIDSADRTAREIDSPDALIASLDTASTSTTADIPGLMQQALDYVVAHQTGRTDIWVCSDLRANDWSPNDGRWSSARDGFKTLDGVKFYLLSYGDPAKDNIAVRVANVRQRGFDSHRELILDVELKREGDVGVGGAVVCEFVINGTRSVVNIDLTGDTYLLQGHQISLDADSPGGWGRIEIPADENLLDNTYYFVFADPPAHHTTIVFEEDSVVDPLRYAATAPLDPAISYTAEVLPASRSDEIDFGKSSLILWQAALPDGPLAEQLVAFAGSGRPIIFFPPTLDNALTSEGGPSAEGVNSLFDVAWYDWQRSVDDQTVTVASWRGDSDLLAHARSGEPLGVGELRTFAYREILATTGSPLARLDGGAPLLYRANIDGGAAYFCTTLPLLTYSSLAQDGIAFYALIQRALSRGAATQSNATETVAGSLQAKRVVDWQPADPASRNQLLSSRWQNAGAYENNDERLAINRPPTEDLARILDEKDVGTLFAGLDFQQVNQSLSTAGALTSEIWRAVLAIMGLALIVEAFLCLPEPKPEVTG